MENIVINFSADTTGLQPGLDGLVQIGIAEQEIVDKAKKVSAEMDKSNKAVADGTKKSVSQVDQLAKSFKGLEKNIIGGAYNQALKELASNINNTADEYKALGLAIDFAKKRQTELKPNSKEWKELEDNIRAGEEVLAIFGKTADETGGKAKSLKAELRELKQEIASRLESGESGAEIDALIARAGELDDRLKDVNAQISAVGSDTRNIEGLVQIAGAITGGFAAAQGAAALFGEESEDVQKALLKVNAAMAVLQGLQQIQTTLQKETAASQLLLNGRRLIGVGLAKLEAAAESETTVVRIAAIAAQKTLNAVMSVNPIALVVTALVALTAAMAAYANNARQAAADTATLGSALSSINEGLNSELAGIDRANKRIIASMKERGASDEELTKQEVSNSNIRNQARQRELERANAALEKVTGTDEESLQRKTELQNAIIRIEEDIREEVIDAQTKVSEFRREQYLKDLRSASAFAEAKVLLAKRGSRAELDAQIEAARAARAEALSNPNLSAGERSKIEADFIAKKRELNFNFEKAALENSKLAIDARVLLAKEGSKEQFDFQLQQARSARDIELKDQQLTANKKALIESNYLKTVEQLTKAFNQRVAEDSQNASILETQQSIAALQLQNTSENNAILLQQKKQLIDQQAALEITSVTFSEQNEELRRLKVKAIQDKSLLDKKALEDAKNAAEIESVRANSDAELAIVIARNEAILRSSDQSIQQQLNAQTAIFQAQRDIIANEEIALNEKRSKGLIDEEAYQLELLKIKLKYINQDAAEVEDAERRKIAARQAAIQLFNQAATFAVDITRRNYDSEIQQIEDLKTKKKISEDEYQKRLKAIRTKQAQDEKKQALFSAVVSSGPALIQAFKQGGFAGFAVATGLILGLIAQLRAAQVPQFRDGVIGLQGPGTETSDSIPAMLSRNESVITASATKKWKEALTAINNDSFESYLASKVPEFISIDSMPKFSPSLVQARSKQVFDYNKLAQAIASATGEPVVNNISLDRDGFNLSVLKGLETLHFKNKKLNA